MKKETDIKKIIENDVEKKINLLKNASKETKDFLRPIFLLQFTAGMEFTLALIKDKCIELNEKEVYLHLIAALENEGNKMNFSNGVKITNKTIIEYSNKILKNIHGEV